MVAYGCYIPIGIKFLFDKSITSNLPAAVIINLIYVLLVSILFIGRILFNIFDKKSISPHIINYEDSAVYEVDPVEI